MVRHRLLSQTIRRKSAENAVSGDAQELEHAIRGILWLREVGLTSGSVYLLDVGLSETGGRIVQALCEKWEFVTLLPEERLSDLFKTGS